jgi:hypothetical protein
VYTWDPPARCSAVTSCVYSGGPWCVGHVLQGMARSCGGCSPSWWWAAVGRNGQCVRGANGQPGVKTWGLTADGWASEWWVVDWSEERKKMNVRVGDAPHRPALACHTATVAAAVILAVAIARSSSCRSQNRKENRGTRLTAPPIAKEGCGDGVVWRLRGNAES